MHKLTTRMESMEADAPFWRSHLHLLPCDEIQVISDIDKVINRICMHKLVPGLDADYCPRCRAWYVNQAMRDRLVPPKR